LSALHAAPMESVMTDRSPDRPRLLPAFGPVFLVLAFLGFCFLVLAGGLWLILSAVEESPTIS
jgi:hypothetical protein